MNEITLKKILHRALNNDFVVRPDVKGRFLVDNSPVEIDFLIYPRDHLINNGFEKFWIGVEVKSPDVKEPVKQGLKVAWQAITYAQSAFTDIGNLLTIENIRPSFVLIYPPIWEFFPKIKAVGPRNNYYEYNQSYLLNSLIQKGNVGNMVLDKDLQNWEIEFSGSQYYYSTKNGRSKIINLGTKKHVGCR
ncbi:MAG: hypothetical protein H8D96_21000 [Desulfobacterales bacterium]|uniref:Uncharacterized protein n=1 Tax=Candidatus Desulfatibia vada TaxID=2841696 RepID=A0A8J6P219_9BACT|nr:hypothetical protein [Candidatus Desulfatibia vada]MBL7216612.1 hypothetical protein [Desulfobacteraceae bacterium]